MKTKLLVLIIILLSINISPLSDSHYYYVKVKNGNIYYGMIIERVKNDHIKLQTISHNIIYIEWSDIVKLSAYKIREEKIKTDIEKVKINLPFAQLKKDYLGTKYIVSLNIHFRGKDMIPYISIEKPLFFNLKKYFFITGNLLYDEKFFTNIDLLFGYKLLKIKSRNNIFFSLSFGGYYSIINNCKEEYGITAELLMGNTFLDNDIKSFNLRYGLKFISFHYEYEEIDGDYYFYEEFGPQVYFTIGWGFNI